MCRQYFRAKKENIMTYTQNYIRTQCRINGVIYRAKIDAIKRENATRPGVAKWFKAMRQ